MISTFDLTKLNALLRDFYNITKIRITIFDDAFQELAAYPAEIAPFCRLIRMDEAGREKCRLCDKEACRIAAKRHSLYTYRCHAGLTESIAPVYMGNILIGYLFFGHVFAYPSFEAGWKQIKTLCKDYNVDMKLLEEACRQQPVISDDYIVSASQILQTVASYLCLDRMVSLKKQDLFVQVDEYIARHYAEPIDASFLCRHFHIGKTRLYEIGKQNYGIGIAQHIRNLRIEKAKELLSGSELPLAEIAFQCGFKDYNYFITVFKRVTGVSPKRYAKAMLSAAP